MGYFFPDFFMHLPMARHLVGFGQDAQGLNFGAGFFIVLPFS
jgi:hypothetical protein